MHRLSRNPLSLFSVAILFTITAMALPAAAQDHDHAGHSMSEPVHDPQLLTNIMQAVAAGWENADGTPFERHYLDFEGARYVESGGQNEGLRDLVDHHVVPEGDALDGLTLEVTNIETHFEGSFAWAVADVDVKATIASSGESLHRSGYETFLFRWVDSEWKVVHTHSSTRPVRR